jgi:hypothetical protein
MSGLQPLGGGGGGGLAPVGGGGASPSTPTPPAQPNPAPAAATPPAPYSYSPGQQTPPNPAGIAPGPARAAALYDEPSAGPNKILLGVIGVALVALAILVYFVVRTPPPVPAPAGYTSWTAADNSIACDTPNGWTVTTHGKASKTPEHVSEDGVEMSRSGARVTVTLNDVAGLVAGQLLLEGSPVPEGMTGSRAAGMHRQTKRGVKNSFKGYKESRLETPPFQNGMGGTFAREGARSMDELAVPDYEVSEFTADGNRFGLGGKVHGYRASLAGGQLIASVVCVCPERDWATLKPAFHHVLESLHEVAPAKKGGGIAVPGSGVTVPGGIPGVGGG